MERLHTGWVPVSAISLRRVHFPPVAGSAPGALPIDMVVAYVHLYSALPATGKPTSRVYRLLLPSAQSKNWAELSLRPSPFGGYGVFPRWNDIDMMSMPVLLPYFGVESVIKDAFAHNALLDVLKGDFQRVTIAELQALHGVEEIARSGKLLVRTSTVIGINM